MSSSRMRLPDAANEAAKFTAVVVLPTPPFWLAMEITRLIGPPFARFSLVGVMVGGVYHSRSTLAKKDAWIRR